MALSLRKKGGDLQLIFVAENSVTVFAIVITLPVVPLIVSNGEVDLMKNFIIGLEARRVSITRRGFYH